MKGKNTRKYVKIKLEAGGRQTKNDLKKKIQGKKKYENSEFLKKRKRQRKIIRNE